MIRLALLLAVALIVLYPLSLLVQSSFLLSAPGQPTSYGLSGWQSALSQPGILDALTNTATLTAARVGFALLISVPIAWALARTDIPVADWLEFGFWIGFFLPALPVVMGWIVVFDPQFGLANTLTSKLFGLHKGPFNIYSWWGIVWAHVTTVLVAVMVMLLTPAFRNLDLALDEASRMSGASAAETARRITAPLAAPAILLAVLITTIRLLESFEVELILGLPSRLDVFSTKIYRLIVAHQPPQFAPGSALGVLVLVAVVPLALLYNRFISRKSYATISGKYRGGRIRLGAWRWPAFALVLLAVLVGTVLPFGFVLLSSFMQLFGFFGIENAWTLDHWRTVFSDNQFFSSLKNTFIIAGGSAAISVACFSVLAYYIVRTRGSVARALDLLTWIPFMLPGILLSLALFWMFLRVPLLTPMFGTHAALIVAIALANMTLGVQLLKTVLIQIGNELEESSWMSGAAWWYTYTRVIVPLTAPALITVALISFASAARNVSHIILLGTGSTRPLSLLQLDYIVDGRYEVAAVVGVITISITVLVAIILRRFGTFAVSWR